MSSLDRICNLTLCRHRWWWCCCCRTHSPLSWRASPTTGPRLLGSLSLRVSSPSSFDSLRRRPRMMILPPRFLRSRENYFSSTVTRDFSAISCRDSVVQRGGDTPPPPRKDDDDDVIIICVVVVVEVVYCCRIDSKRRAFACLHSLNRLRNKRKSWVVRGKSEDTKG